LAVGTISRADQVVGSRHARHPLIGDQERHLISATDQLSEALEALLARTSAHDPVALGELTPEILGHRGQHRRLIVHHQDRGSMPCGLGHRAGAWESAAISVSKS
jgi:hypothetical protein